MPRQCTVPVASASSKHPPKPKPKGSGQPTRTRGFLANGRTVQGASNPCSTTPGGNFSSCFMGPAGPWELAVGEGGVGTYFSREAQIL